VVDLDELAVAVALAGPNHDTRRDGDDVGTLAAGEIDAFVERAPARERIGAATELRRDIARGHGPPLRANLVPQLAIQQQVLEDRELNAAVGELLVQHVERADDAVDLHRLRVRQRLFGTAQRRSRGEIEFAVLEPGHLRETGAKRVQADDMRVHLPDAQRQGVEILLQRAPRAVDDRLLLRELVAPRGNLRLRIADTE
jgi:hypothetical protein